MKLILNEEEEINLFSPLKPRGNRARARFNYLTIFFLLLSRKRLTCYPNLNNSIGHMKYRLFGKAVCVYLRYAWVR